jgi:hypothetical protein
MAMMQIEVDAIIATVFFILILIIALICIILAVSLISGGKNSIQDQPEWLIDVDFPSNTEEYLIAEYAENKFAWSNFEKILYIFNSFNFPPNYIFTFKKTPFKNLDSLQLIQEPNENIVLVVLDGADQWRRTVTQGGYFVFTSVPWS